MREMLGMLYSWLGSFDAFLQVLPLKTIKTRRPNLYFVKRGMKCIKLQSCFAVQF